MKYLNILIIFFIYVIILIITYTIYINIFKIDVVLYSSIFCSFLASIIITVFLFIVRKFKIFSFFEKILIIIICSLIGYSLAISLPTVIDRSLSFYILEKIHQRGGGIQLNKMDIVFTKEYIIEHKLIDIRITEQLQSNTIIIEDECLKLTKKGKKLVKFSRFFRKYFLPKKRLIRNEYSDKLIDPFMNSDLKPNYICK